MNIIFFGADKFVVPIIKELRTTYTISLILTTEKLHTDPVSSYAITHHIPYLQVKKFTHEIIDGIKKENAEIAVLAYFGLILPKTILDLFPKGILNVHPSLLPKYRGPTPVQSAMIAGEEKTGVSIIKLDDQVDHGPLLAQEEEPITSLDTDETLHNRLFTKGASLLLTVIPPYISGTLAPAPQDHTKATFTEKLTRDAGYFDSNNPPSPDILQRRINAYYPWPGVWTTIEIHGEKKRIKFLPGNKVHVQDKKPMSYKDFLNGYPEKKPWLEKLGVLTQ